MANGITPFAPLTKSSCYLYLLTLAKVMDRALELVDADAGLSARDAVHAAVVQVYGLEGICTFDRDFDRVPGCHCVEPSAGL